MTTGRKKLGRHVSKDTSGPMASITFKVDEELQEALRVLEGDLGLGVARRRGAQSIAIRKAILESAERVRNKMNYGTSD